MAKYEPFHPISHSLSPMAISMAVAKCYGDEMPTLFVSEELFPCLPSMNHVPIQTAMDPDLKNQEWYVELNGKRFGSIGC